MGASATVNIFSPASGPENEKLIV